MLRGETHLPSFINLQYPGKSFVTAWEIVINIWSLRWRWGKPRERDTLCYIHLMEESPATMEPAKLTFEFEEPDVSHLITEDDEPVDNPFSEKQQRMLADSLHASWTKEMREGRPFVAFANVGLFFVPKNPALVPDVQVSLDVELPEDLWEKKNRSYMTWVYGKPPDIVLEIVSNTKGGETDRKFKTYAEQGVAYYIIYDPQTIYGSRPLRAYELHGRTYVEMLEPSWLPGALIGLKLWEGVYEDYKAVWIRWCDRQGQLLPLAREQVERATKQAEEATKQAEEATRRAEEAKKQLEERAKQVQDAEDRAARLEARLKELGDEV